MEQLEVNCLARGVGADGGQSALFKIINANYLQMCEMGSGEHGAEVGDGNLISISAVNVSIRPSIVNTNITAVGDAVETS